MGEAFTIATGVAGLLSLTIQVTQISVDYVKGVRKASVAVEEFRGELIALASVLEQFEEFLKRDDPKAAFKKTSVLYEANSSCEQQLRKLLTKFDRNLKGGRFSQAVDRLTWPFDEKEHRRAIEDLHRHAQTFQFALNISGYTLLSQTSEEVSQVLVKQIKTLDQVQQTCVSIPDLVSKAQEDANRSKQILQLLSTLPNYQAGLDRISKGVESLEKIANAEKIIEWLAAPLPSANHNTATRKREPSTGEWFTQSKEFSDWKMEASSFIWLHGIPGCGKTILCSTIIQDVKSHYKSEPTKAITYFYFDFNDLSLQRTEKFIRSLIVQLSAQYRHLPESLQSAYSRSQNGQNQLTTEELILLFRQMARDFNSTYILLDALDECTDRKDLFEFLKGLMDGKADNFHIIATSRKENDITTYLKPLVTCQISIQDAVVDADIRVHILKRISTDPKLKKWPIDARKEIEDILMRGAKGMFRWVECQLESLQKCLSRNALRKTLDTLPKTLDETYERILANLDEEYEGYALTIFQWLCFSRRPMLISEMVEVLAIDQTAECFEPDQRFPDPLDVLTICSSLVSVTAAADQDTLPQATEPQELRLAHFSVSEYLRSEGLKKASMRRYHIPPSSANLSIAKSCLIYLLHFESPIILTAESKGEFPLIEYAAKFWPRHYRHVIDDANREAIDLLGYNLVDTKKFCFINWLNAFNHLEGTWTKFDFNGVGSPLFYMSLLGVAGVVKLLLNKHADANAEQEAYRQALLAAVYKGYEGVALLLLEQGADINAEHDIFGPVLSVASFWGHKEVVQLLLEKGANVNAEGGQFDNALSAASYSGHERVVQLLLEKGANINAEGRRFGNALSAASYSGRERVVRLLLEKGANINAEGGQFDNALSAASYSCEEGVVRLLLEKGANINTEGGPYNGDALSVASRLGQEGVVRLFLENGADVNAQSGRALRSASENGRLAVMRLLLQNKADVTLLFDDGKALQELSVDDHGAVVELLLKEFTLP